MTYGEIIAEITERVEACGPMAVFVAESVLKNITGTPDYASVKIDGVLTCDTPGYREKINGR